MWARPILICGSFQVPWTHLQDMDEGHEQSLFTRSQSEILKLMNSNHDPEDVDSLFIITRSFIKRSTQIVYNIVQGIQSDVIAIAQTRPTLDSFRSPLCTLTKSIGRKMSYMGPSDEIALESKTLGILKMLSKYPWKDKAVLVLAAFAMQYEKLDQYAESLAFLEQVPDRTNPANLLKRQAAIIEINNLINATLHVIECIYEIEKLYNIGLQQNKNKKPYFFDLQNVASLASAMKDMPVNVYWSTITIVACATKVNLLASNENQEKPYDLSQFSHKIDFIANNLTGQLTICEKEIKKAAEIRKQAPREVHGLPPHSYLRVAEVSEVFKARIFANDNVQPIIDGSTNKKVDISVLRWKNVLLFFSSLGISDADISPLKRVYDEGLKTQSKYKIVWIPIVDNWTDALLNKFYNLRIQMPWYIVQYFSPVASCIKFIKEEWHFRGRPMVVVLNPQGKVQNTDALPMIRRDGMRAFPFHNGN